MIKIQSNDIWHSFYESAWDLRARFIRELIEKGETNVSRIISLMEQHERFHKTVQNAEDEPAVFELYPNIPEQESRNFSIGDDGISRIESYSYLPTGVSAATASVFLENSQLESSYSETSKIAFILDYIRNKKIDAIVELGSGYSQNLFKLFFHGGPNIPYYGGEYTNSGTECAHMLAELLPECKLKNFGFDFNDPDFSTIGEYENVLVFTCHAIEQVENLSENSLPAIAKLAKNVHCLHFEPFGWQLQADSINPNDRNQREYFMKNKWNFNLAQRLIQASTNGDINLTFVGKNVMGSLDRGYNCSSLAVWNNG